MNTLDYIVNKYNIQLVKDMPIEIPNVGRNEFAELLSDMGFNLGVEVGVWRGEYSEVLCKANPQLKLYSVDPWDHKAFPPGIKGWTQDQADYDAFYEQAVKRLGLIIEANAGWRELFGHDPSEVVGHTSLELNSFANPEDRKEAVRRIQEQGSVRNFELEIRKKYGEIRLASLSAEKIEVNGEAALLTVLRDITERKRAEKQIAVPGKAACQRK